jgi:GC-rich sequence DNA-binding factor
MCVNIILIKSNTIHVLLYFCCSRKLQPLVAYVLSLGKILERRNVQESDLARRLKRILVDLNEYDHARTMARTFHLKEAL